MQEDPPMEAERREDPSGEMPFRQCTHTRIIDEEAVRASVSKPWEWVCQGRGCRSCADLLVCLECGFRGCGREQEGQHALAHYRRQRHPLVMSVNDGSVYCYECDEWVLTDNREGDIAFLREILCIRRDASVPESRTRSGQRFLPGQKLQASRGFLPSFGKVDEAKTRHRDLLTTAETHCNLSLLGKCFAAWERFAGMRQTEPLQPAEEDDGASSYSPFTPSLTAPPVASHPREAPSRLIHTYSPVLPPAATTTTKTTTATTTPVHVQPLATRPRSAPATLKRAGVPRPLRETPHPHEFSPRVWTPRPPSVAPTTSSSAGRGGTGSRARRGILPGRTGLHNMGNSCYLSAVVQCLSAIRPFRWHFLSLEPWVFHEDARVEPVSPHQASTLAQTHTVVDSHRTSAPQWQGGHGAFSVAVPDSNVQQRERRPLPSTSTLATATTTATPPTATNANPETVQNGGGDALFALSHPPLLRRLQTSEVYSEMHAKSKKQADRPNLSLCLELHHLFRLLWSGRWAVITPYKFLYAVWRFLPQFRSYQQQDAQEFCVALLDCLHEELARGGVPPVADGSASSFMVPRPTPPASAAPSLLQLNPGSGTGSRQSPRSGATATTARSLRDANGSGLRPAALPGRPLLLRSISASFQEPHAADAGQPSPLHGGGEGSNGESEKEGAEKKTRVPLRGGGGRGAKQSKTATQRKSSQRGKRRRQSLPQAPMEDTEANDDGSMQELDSDEGDDETKKSVAKRPSSRTRRSTETRQEISSASSRKKESGMNGSTTLPRTTRRGQRKASSAETKDNGTPAASTGPGRGRRATMAPPSRASVSSARQSPGNERNEPVAMGEQTLPRFAPSRFIGNSVFGSMLSQITCDVCRTVSSTEQQFTCLSVNLDSNGEYRHMVPVPSRPEGSSYKNRSSKGRRSSGTKKDDPADADPPIQLYQCFHKTLASERLEGDCAYMCDACGKKQDATRRIFLHRLPEVLILHLDRARWTMRGKEKLQDDVQFPLEGLSLRSFLSPSAMTKPSHRDRILAAEFRHVAAHRSSSGGSAPTLPAPDLVRYDLKGVVQHEGRGIDRGHYTAFAKDSARDVWLHYNDSRVRVVSPGDVSHAQAYLLFYQRREMPMSHDNRK